MLSPVEKLLFVLLTALAVGAAYQGFYKMWLIINRGGGKLYLDKLPQRMLEALRVYLLQITTLKTRRAVWLFHLGIVLGFTYYFLVNVVDGLKGMFEGVDPWLNDLTGLPEGIYNAYRFFGDILSVAVLVGMVYFILRRFVLPNKKDLTFHDNVLLHPAVKSGGIITDSMIVGGFILLHVGARFLGEAVHVAQLSQLNQADSSMWFATLVSPLFAGANAQTLDILRHLFWWVALGGILIFTPYFPYSKHAHLFMAPLNFLTRPHRTSLGELEPVNLEDESIEQFGANKLEHLTKTQIFDAFACIQCNRCQDVCPAYLTGKELSPSALEINKRYFIRDHFDLLAMGAESPASLVGTVISESAVWACTSCGACIDICPVGNEPMFDILDIRRDMVLTQGDAGELQGAFTNMEKRGNPWGVSGSRLAWADGLDVPTIEDNPDFEVLYWTGCAVSYDDRAKKTARDFVKVLKNAGVNFAVLGEGENCTGDVARRGGNEYLYFELASANVETLNEVKPKRIVVTCPHCLHNLSKEYPQFGGVYTVVHHTQLIDELIQAGKLPAAANPKAWSNVTFHDPCYLGRHNSILEEPRQVLSAMGAPLIEMPRHGTNSLCCGAGGAQFWKEEEHGAKAVNLERYQEAKATGAETLAVGCPFCMQMFETARANVGGEGPVVKDIVELLAEKLPDPAPAATGD